MEKNRIFFQKPNLELFDSMGLMSFDMHFHTRYSDSYTTIHSLLKKAWKKRMGVAITDHNTIEGNLKAQNNPRGVPVIPGIEVSCIEGPHVILYFYSADELKEFYEKHIKPKKQGNPYMAINTEVAELIDATKDYNCVRCAPHPFGYSLANSGLSKCIKKHYVNETVFNYIDVMEVICGAMNRRLNKKAESRALELDKGFSGGTDGHTILELGNIVTSSYSHDIDSFLTSLLKKKNYVIGRETSLIPKSNVLPSMVSKHMKYALPSIRMQYHINKGRVRNVPRKIINKTVQIRERLKDMANGKH